MANFSDAYYEYNPWEHIEFYIPMIPIGISLISVFIVLIIGV